MVKLDHKGLSSVTFREFKVIPGQNEMADDVFYKLMLHPSFALRIKNGTFTVPFDFPLQKPYSVKKSVAEQEAIKESAERYPNKKEEKEEDSSTVSSTKMGTKQSLRAIAASEDEEELKGFMNDDREKVVEAASKKLESLKK